MQTVIYCVAIFYCCSINAQSLNKRVIEYTRSVIGKTVDRGECWDLANRALEFAQAKRPDKYVFGRVINNNKEPIKPGDIIQFTNVKLKFIKEGKEYQEIMKKHTAIIMKTGKDGVLKIADQNTGYSGRKVAIRDFRWIDVIKGKVTFYRPVKP